MTLHTHNPQPQLTNSIHMNSLLNLQREANSVDLSHIQDNYNLYLLNDGTGSGKTHNVVMNFIKQYNNHASSTSGRRSMIFVAPQKNQLFANPSVFLEAAKSNIPLLFARSEADLVHLSSKNYLRLNQTNEEFQTVAQYFKQIFSNLKPTDKREIENKLETYYNSELRENHQSKDTNGIVNTDMTPLISNKRTKLASIYLLEAQFNTLFEFERKNKALKEYSPDQYEHDLKECRQNFRFTLQTLANNLSKFFSDETLKYIFTNFTHSSDAETRKLFGTNYRFYEFTYLLLLYIMPFEVAKYINCVIYMTGAKSQYTFQISRHKNNGKGKEINTPSFDELISGHSISSKADILGHSRDSDSSFGEFLQNEYFLKNPNNYFMHNKIGFSVVYDEEHTLYNLFTDRYSYKKITEKERSSVSINIIHALASLKRWLRNTKSHDTHSFSNDDALDQAQSDIIKNLFIAIKKYTPFKTDHDFEEFLDAIEANELGIFMKSSDHEFIQAVCSNALAYSPKFIMSQDSLDGIKLRLNAGSSRIVLSKQKHDNISQPTQKSRIKSVEYSVLDLFKVILTLLYVCKDRPPALQGKLESSQDSNSQNVAIYHLLDIASDHKDFLTNLFASSLTLTQDDPINIQFAYFLTKIGLTFEFPKEIPVTKMGTEYIAVLPHVFVIKELPEVHVLQILKNPANKVFLLSATRGFERTFSGNYSKLFFEQAKRYCPGMIKIFQRELSHNNPMPKFIDYRFGNRTSISVNAIQFNNLRSINNKAQQDTVELLSYSIPNVSSATLHLTHDVPNTRITYPLISHNRQNFLEHMPYSLKKSSEYGKLPGRMSKSEIIGVINSNIHAYEHHENSIIMTLSNKFYNNFVDSFLVQTLFSNIYYPIIDDPENQRKIFEFSPEPLRKIRIICFDAKLGRMPNLDKYFISEPSTTIILVSSYLSAGTGLNFTIKQPNNQPDVDFNSIYFVSSPYYTTVKKRNNDDNISNQLLIFKYLSHELGNTISSLSDIKSAKKNKTILKHEHSMEQVKNVMQATGRIERRDCMIETKIYFVENPNFSNFDSTMFNFNDMHKLHSKNSELTVVSNFSMLTKSLIKAALNHTAENAMDMTSRTTLERETRHAYDAYYTFFTHNFPHYLKEYRSQNPDFFWLLELNSIFRSYTTPHYDYKAELISFIQTHKSALIHSNSYGPICSLVQYAYFNFLAYQIPENKKITIDYNAMHYSDCSSNNKIITDSTLFSYFSDELPPHVAFNDQFLGKIDKQYCFNNSLTHLPNLYLTHIIRGNIAENVLSQYLNSKGIIFNNISQLFGETVHNQLYELFDFYIVKDGTIYAIDTKNWNLYYDTGATNTLMKFQHKTALIKNIAALSKYKFRFIYLNMSTSIKSDLTSGLSSHFSGFKDVDYINFISRQTQYKYKSKNKKHLLVPDPENDIYTINSEWSELL